LKVLLFSGGIDSAAIAWMEKPDVLLFIDYGQLPARGELRASTSLARGMGLRLEARTVPLRDFGRGIMVGKESVATDAPEFWPLRNQMLITLAAMAFADQEPLEILIGTVATDVVHPDGRPEFIDRMNEVLCAQGNVRLRAPAIGLTGHQLVEQSKLPAELLGWTFSCHTGEWACGRCRGCTKHVETRRTAGGFPS